MTPLNRKNTKPKQKQLKIGFLERASCAKLQHPQAGLFLRPCHLCSSCYSSFLHLLFSTHLRAHLELFVNFVMSYDLMKLCIDCVAYLCVWFRGELTTSRCRRGCAEIKKKKFGNLGFLISESDSESVCERVCVVGYRQ